MHIFANPVTNELIISDWLCFISFTNLLVHMIPPIQVGWYLAEKFKC